MQADLAEVEAGLRGRRECYARVTVVWSCSPVSARAGDMALVTGDGRLQGWVGGSCAEPIVIRQAMAALAGEAPTLVHLGPPDQLPPGREGLVVAPVTCASEGSLEVFIEPCLPPPHLVVIGSAPLVGALAVMAGAVDFEVTVVERDGSQYAWCGKTDHSHSSGAGSANVGGAEPANVGGAEPANVSGAEPANVSGAEPANVGGTGEAFGGTGEAFGGTGEAFGGARVIGELDLAKAGAGPDTFVVVATMGRYDEDALEAALATGARYVALVASDRRASRVRELLRDGGLSAADLARVRAPAGLDLGDLPHAEIAVAILAEMVAEKARTRDPARHVMPEGAAGAGQPALGLASPPPGAAKPPASTAVDPVCGMAVEVAGAQDVAEHGDSTWWFCSSGCRRRFQASPETFVGAPAGRTADVGPH